MLLRWKNKHEDADTEAPVKYLEELRADSAPAKDESVKVRRYRYEGLKITCPTN